ncbi:Ig-like domain-containing protein [uncultured Agrococcus sp.]|uniref:Ig-like domain-containing protein n=1 Tax=uncultured Agrococcus sp. TaxID=382258 RepID=UPI0025E650DB|nr:Ig-like domain-containing protein [uncultured Agrococcus sp.]
MTLAIRDETENTAPAELRDEQGFEVEQRAQYDHSVLEGWFDPDGDDLFLVDAYSDSGDTVRFNPNGRIIYTATGEPGPTTMTVVVSDGVDESEGTIEVDVLERGTSSPIANADYVSVGEGGHVSVNPLANDFLPAGENARLASASVRDDAGITIDVDRSTDTVHISGDVIGTHFIDYTVAAGPNQSQGHVRVDVVEPVEDATPVAVRDVALLPMGGEALVDLTENDVDPSGGVLVVQSVDTDSEPINVQLMQRHMLRIDDQQGLTERTTMQYQVSNGSETAVGEVVIIPVEPPDRPRNPVAVDDTAALREGDYATIDVTENDFSPDNIPFSVEPELVESSLEPDEGHVFVDGDDIRVHVGVGGPSFVEVIYEIRDGQDNTATGTLRVDVEPRDPDTNSPPHAREVTSRVLAGNEVRIPVPLDGIDPDGDGVTLVGWETAPDQGRITEVGADYIDFEAFADDGGTTTFQYRVRDRWGAESVSSITVGIAQPSDVNQAPHAALDTVHVRPDRAVAVSVLDNDSDPDGDELRLVDVNTEDAPAELTDLRLGSEAPTVNFTAPSEPGDYMLEYTIRDVRGASAIGAVHVIVDEEAPLEPPQAVDDIVDVEDLTVGEPFVVPVLENDRDVDGDPSELSVEVLTGEGTVVDDGVQIEPGDEFQVITYRATDQDGGHGEAFIFVPGVGERLPYIAADTQLVVGSGELLEIDLNEVVVMPEGGTPRITTNDMVSATNDNGEPLVVSEDTLAYTSELGYVGDAAISFEITDGTGPNDPDALTARLTVPIVVTPSSQVPPEFHGAEIQVEPGEAPTEFDLTSATWDPDDGDIEGMEYDIVGGEADGVTVDISGQTFLASAEHDTTPGTRGSYQIELRDPAGNVEPGTVTVEVVPSNRQMPRAADDSGTTDQGVEISINVLENDFNPFENIGEPLNVRDVRVLRGDASSGPTTDGTNVTVTPGDDFSGVLTLQYTIEDATATDARTAVGNVEISVRGRPDAPLRPNVNSIGDSEVTLSWAAPSSNGAPISGYIVQWDGGSQECDSTSCTVTGLANDNVYNFEILAVNEVGESDPSPASIDARPDVRPEQPEAPTADRGDRELHVTWDEPENRGSTIEYYLLEISGPGSGETQVQVEGTSYTWDELQNGASYEFRVQAHNNADEPSEWSRYSSAEVPAGIPFESEEVVASSTQGPSRTQINVNWTASDDNGAPIENYTVIAMNDGEEVDSQPVGGQTLSTAFENLPTSSSPYTFHVIAENDVGDSPPAVSNEVRSVGRPGTPSVSLVSDNSNETSTIDITPGDSNGYSDDEMTYQYRLDGGSWQNLSGSGQQSVDPSPKVGGYQLQVRVVATAGDHTYESEASSNTRVSPYGTPPAPPSPNASESGNGQTVTFSWDARQATNGRAIEAVEYQINGGGWQRAAPNDQVSETGDPGDTITIRIRSIPEEGSTSPASNQVSHTLGGPSPTLTVEPGELAPSTVDPSTTAYEVILHYEDLIPGTYDYACYSTNSDTGTNVPFREGTVQLDENGQVGDSVNRDDQQLCVNSQGGQLWVVLTNGPSNDHHGALDAPRRNWPSAA